MDIGVASVISSTIIGVAGIAVSLIYGYIPARRRENASSLLAIEKD